MSEFTEVPETWTRKVVDDVLAIVDQRISHWRSKRNDKPRGMIEEELMRLRVKVEALRK